MSLTGKLGQYQNKVSSRAGLSAISIKDYERIFKVYTQPNNNKEFYFYNILNKIEFPVNIQSNLLSSFTVKSRMPLTTVSYSVYGDIQSWWMIYLLNKNEMKTKFYVEGGQQLQYILPGARERIYRQITKLTVFNNKHF